MFPNTLNLGCISQNRVNYQKCDLREQQIRALLKLRLWAYNAFFWGGGGGISGG